MKRIIYHIFAALSTAILCFSCSDTADEPIPARAICFSTPQEWPGEGTPSRASLPAVFGTGDRIGVFACYSPSGDEAADETFTSNFMCNQPVEFNGTTWAYSPVKYWPTDGNVTFRAYYPYSDKYNTANNGTFSFSHKCETGLEPLYAAYTTVKADKGTLSGDGINPDGNLQLRFTPVLNKVIFTANADDNLFDEVETDEYRDCFFLIKEFRLWGFYKTGTVSFSDKTTCKPNSRYGMYTRTLPLDMTPSLDSREIEKEIPGYKLDPENGYCTEKALVVAEGAEAVNMFGKSAYFIPFYDGRPHNVGFEVVYVVLTKKQGENVYRESGIVTRTGSLHEIFDNNTGLIEKNIHVNLEFSVDGVTVTRNLEDYIYKEMF